MAPGGLSRLRPRFPVGRGNSPITALYIPDRTLASLGIADMEMLPVRSQSLTKYIKFIENSKSERLLLKYRSFSPGHCI